MNVKIINKSRNRFELKLFVNMFVVLKSMFSTKTEKKYHIVKEFQKKN